MAPPTKKRKTIIDTSSATLPPRLASISNRCDVAAPAQISRAPPVTRRAAATVAAGSKPKAAKLKATVPEKSEISQKKTRKLTGQYKSLHSFFGIPQGSAFPSVPASTNSGTPSASQNEDADDLIEDDSDNDNGITAPKRTATRKDSTLSSHLVVSKPGARKDLKSLLSMKVPHGTTPTAVAGKSKSEGSNAPSPPVAPRASPTMGLDTRTWPEKYAPKTVEELALNKMKVKEVRTWLEDVLDGSSQQRVLVLKGSAGTGKTATVDALAKDMGVEILEWRNPHNAASGDEYGEDGAFAAGLSGMFEEFIGRAGVFGSLDLVSSAGQIQKTSSQDTVDDGKKKFIVIEDFPNTLFTSSPTPLQSFRHTIKAFLALPKPPDGAPPLPPLILIITETASISGPNAFTAHRLLSPDILHHPLVREINFNKIAPTYMFKALSAIIIQESRQTGRKFGPSKAVLDALSTSGDIRSAVMGLEFLSMNGDLPGKGFTERISYQKRRGKKPDDRELNVDEKRMVEAVTQRESSYGIFHAVGKVLYNKRYGDDPEDPYVPHQLRPTLDTLPYHRRAVRVDLDALIDETGTDPQTFISGLHENYLGSCNPGGLPRAASTADEDILDTINSCLDNLSDSDLLASKGFGYDAQGGGDSAGIRSDEISFQTAVRGVMMSLPSPVKRFTEARGSGAKMFYPTSARLWKDRQEVTEVLEWYVNKERGMAPCRGGKSEALQERMPFLALVERRKEWARSKSQPRGPLRLSSSEGLDAATKKALEKVTVFKGVGRQSEGPEDDEVEVKVENGRGRWKMKKGRAGDGVGEAVEKLVLSDDDIEEF